MTYNAFCMNKSATLFPLFFFFCFAVEWVANLDRIEIFKVDSCYVAMTARLKFSFHPLKKYPATFSKAKAGIHFKRKDIEKKGE